jgi:transposase
VHMEIVFERCAGLDVHKETVVACVRHPGDGKVQRRGEVRTFSAVTRGLSELAAWLQSERICACGDGVDGCVLASRVRGVGRSV